MLCSLGLGSNLGDRCANLQAACRHLRSLTATDAPPTCSPVYESAPLDCPPGAGPFLNAAAILRWQGTAHDLLAAIQLIERTMGRQRPAPPNAPRPIDIDLLTAGDQRLASEALTLPHPRLRLRAFVLVPLAAIAPDLVPPGSDRTVRALRDALPAAEWPTPFPSCTL